MLLVLDGVQATNWLTLALVVITALYCFFTHRIVEKNDQMVAQMKAQYESFIVPAITVAIQLKHRVIVCLKVKNYGRSSATNLRLTLDRDFYQFGEVDERHNVRTFPAFQQVIPSFSPGEELFFMLSQGFNLGQVLEGRDVTPYEFAVEAQFEFGGRTFLQLHNVDLHPYLQSAQDRDEALEELEKIRKALEK